jgi:hypothetical protein
MRLTRRSFIARLAAIAATGSIPRVHIVASDKAGTRLPIVGTGEHVYECVHDWLRPPEGMVWGDTHALCQDEGGSIYVSHTVHKSSILPEAVAVFDAHGRFVRAFGEEFRGGAHGLAIRREGNQEFLYHCDINRCRLVKTTCSGETVWAQGYPRHDPAYRQPQRYVPTNVAFGPGGEYYIADGYGSSRVLRFSAEGSFRGEIGGPGKGSAEFDTPHGIYVDPRAPQPRLVVADRGNRRIQVFTLDGVLVQEIQQPARLRMPCDFHTRGEWMVCPDLDSQVCILDREYRVVAQLGDGKAENGEVGSRRDRPRSEFGPGKFVTPHDAIFLRNGDILVAEWLPMGRITLLRQV